MVADIGARLGPVDILVNNAAVRREKAFLEMGLDEWHSITNSILDAAFLCTRACLPGMAVGGRVIFMGGISAHAGATRRAHVMTAKAGLVGLTRALAREFLERGITFNCVVPGHVNTTREAGFKLLYEKHEGGGAPSAEPEDIAATIRFLCSPGARHINGQTIHVNGGFLMP
jgi:3-oxoacyl-[acyl-carrier protein] reductase